MNILLGDFSAELGRKDTFKLTIWDENLHEVSNDNGNIVVNFGTSENLIVKSTQIVG
jgi:hypothetical protein